VMPGARQAVTGRGQDQALRGTVRDFGHAHVVSRQP
jgi:hypothetical protein